MVRLYNGSELCRCAKICWNKPWWQDHDRASCMYGGKVTIKQSTNEKHSQISITFLAISAMSYFLNVCMLMITTQSRHLCHSQSQEITRGNIFFYLRSLDLWIYCVQTLTEKSSLHNTMFSYIIFYWKCSNYVKICSFVCQSWETPVL